MLHVQVLKENTANLFHFCFTTTITRSTTSAQSWVCTVLMPEMTGPVYRAQRPVRRVLSHARVANLVSPSMRPFRTTLTGTTIATSARQANSPMNGMSTLAKIAPKDTTQMTYKVWTGWFD